MTNKTFEDGKVVLVASGKATESQEFVEQYFKSVSETSMYVLNKLSQLEKRRPRRRRI